MPSKKRTTRSAKVARRSARKTKSQQKPFARTFGSPKPVRKIPASRTRASFLRKRLTKAAAALAIALGASGCADVTLSKVDVLKLSLMSKEKQSAFVSKKIVAAQKEALFGKPLPASEKRHVSKKVPSNPRGLAGVRPKYREQWKELLGVYYDWRPDSRHGKAVIDLVGRVVQRTDTSPAEVVLVMEKHPVLESTFERLKSQTKLSPTESKIFKRLLIEKNTNWPTFFHLNRWTSRSWGGKRKIEKIVAKAI